MQCLDKPALADDATPNTCACRIQSESGSKLHSSVQESICKLCHALRIGSNIKELVQSKRKLLSFTHPSVSNCMIFCLQRNTKWKLVGSKTTFTFTTRTNNKIPFKMYNFFVRSCRRYQSSTRSETTWRWVKKKSYLSVLWEKPFQIFQSKVLDYSTRGDLFRNR